MKETPMSNLIKTVTALGAATFLAACGGGRDDGADRVVYTQPVTVDPVSEKY
jgi:hypothetical protein